MHTIDMKNIDWPKVSIIVITKGHHEMAESAVASILATDYPVEKREVVVVEETDAPSPIGGEGVKYAAIPVKNLGFPFARNKGVSLASADIIAFTDDDCLVEREWLKELVRPLIESADAAAVAGAVLVAGCGAVGECENILGFPGGGAKYLHHAHGAIMRWTTFSTCNCAVRKSALEASGGFCKKLKNGGEDSFLSKKISENGLILFNPQARVCHRARDSFAGVLRWFIRRGRASVELARIAHDKHAYIATLVFNSVLLRLAMVIAVCGVLGWPVLPVISALVLVYYFSVLWRFRWARLYYSSIKTFLLVPVVKAIMDIGMDLGILSSVFNPPGRVNLRRE
ncbi:MAG: glycosyltransferase family 2 protein [Kiritimatiellae bacterium]|nr:glycosyltransferase family 2 protein [Kiritimatiellia bacterium]